MTCQSELQEREYLTNLIDSKFTRQEQNILWACTDSKEDPDFHYELDHLVRKHMTSTVPVELYRGVTPEEVERLSLLSVGCHWSPGRVTSFTTDFSTARQFSGSWEYQTYTILSLRNAPFIFDYYQNMVNIVLAGKNPKHVMEETRIDVLDMIESEQEYMVSGISRFEIVKIEDLEYDPLSRLYKIIHLKMLNF
ncbi:ribosyltransferase [Escherichia phage AV112]|nr:ribosyltransferase [Escherichia phage AV112]WPK34757.1 ribosyltransferase [Escherichia phage AV113]